MKRTVVLFLILFLVPLGALAEDGFEGRPILKNVSMPTGFTLNQGEFTVGLGSIGFGISDRVQLSTNILLYLLQVYNGDCRINLVQNEQFSLAGGLGLHHFNLEVGADEVGFTSFSPYIAVSPRLNENTVLHFSGRYSHFSGEANIDDAEAKAVVEGTSFSAGIEYSLSHKTKFLADGGYDTTWDGLRISGAVLFGWEKFRLKLGVTYFNPQDSQSFTMPVIGIWWRFNG